MKACFIIIIALAFNKVVAQNFYSKIEIADNACIVKSISKENSHNLKFKNLIIPTSLLGYGFVACDNKGLKNLNRSTSREIKEDHPFYTTKVDNYLQYAPAVLVYGLNAAGIKGENNFKSRTIIYALSNVFSCAIVSPIKLMSKMERPDASAHNSFPSGHTATAFAAAEFLRKEYKDVSVWYGIGGYCVAAFTGSLRVYNNRHWLSDIVAGAGIGILSTKISYWVYPYLKRTVLKDRSSTQKHLNAADIENLPVEIINE